MPAKVRIYCDDRFCGWLTVFDSEPSWSLLLTAFPDAWAICQHLDTGIYSVYLGEATAMPVMH